MKQGIRFNLENPNLCPALCWKGQFIASQDAPASDNAGKCTMSYDPPRQSNPKPPADPLEIDLVVNVRPWSTCSFFWPEDSSKQPYGPYPCYDFDSNTPAERGPEGETSSFVWLKGTTRPAAFPDAEVMDGCRKAPIMTIGINPNLTAFALGKTGASWVYPSFSSDGVTDSWT